MVIKRRREDINLHFTPRLSLLLLFPESSAKLPKTSHRIVYKCRESPALSSRDRYALVHLRDQPPSSGLKPVLPPTLSFDD